MIKSLNIDYSGPIDGHDILAVIKELRRLQKIKARNSSRDNYKRKIETGRRKPGEIPCSRKI
jgi:hypothetical protein